jgi:hypothetical protein
MHTMSPGSALHGTILPELRNASRSFRTPVEERRSFVCLLDVVLLSEKNF